MLKGLAAVAAALLLAGCGSSGHPSSSARTTPSPTAAPAVSTACRAGAQELAARYQSVAKQADAGTLYLDVLQREAKQIYAVAQDRMDGVCSATVMNAATAADHQLSLVVADLTICSIKRSMCVQTRSQGTRSLALALRSAAEVRLLVQ